MSSFIYVSSSKVISKTSSNIPSSSDFKKVFNLLYNFPIVSIDLETYVPLNLKGHTATSALNPHNTNISLLIIKPEQTQPTIIIDWLALESDPDFIPLVTDLLKTRECIVA